ncbi:MAG TPA: phenylacetate--CoA ligase family protein [Blastocatellia bacterium]|nr:phenylacetate--CoA ligase family protein [Blastocatellia bacterium]
MPEPLFYNRQVETLDRARLRSLQDERLRALLKEIAANRFYSERLRAAGITWGEVRSLDDLAGLPFTTKHDLVAEQEAAPPYGNLPTYALDRYRYFHQTSGTSGRPLKWLDTEESWDWWARCWGYVYGGAGVTSEDVVFCAFSFGPYISHWTAITGAWRAGAMSISGGGLSSDQRLSLLLDNRATVLVSTPTYALHLAEVARERGIDLSRCAVRVNIHAGEPGASLPAVRRKIEQEWGSTCFDHAGATEVGAWAFACQAESEAIHLNEAEFIFEIIDPETTRLLDPTATARGELVITNLGRAGMPVVRYRTGDIVEIGHEPCACGRSFAQIRGGVLGRADDMIIVRGVNLYPSAIDDLLRTLPNVVEYEVEIRKVAGLDDLLIKIEVDDASGFEEAARAVLAEFRSRFNMRVEVEQLLAGTLPRYEFKARRYKRIAD